MPGPFDEIRPGLIHAENIPLQLLRRGSGQGAGPRVSSGMSIHVFSELLRIGGKPVIAAET